MSQILAKPIECDRLCVKTACFPMNRLFLGVIARSDQRERRGNLFLPKALLVARLPRHARGVARNDGGMALSV